MADVTCRSCRADNRAGAKFCGECGAALTAVCTVCGNPVPGRFCSECGTALASPVTAGTAPPAGDGEPVAERRIVSLLFGDLVGFTPLSERRDPEAVRELLSAYFERTRALVERYGGVVEKFIGDAVFAVWGVPAAHEDDAERAVRAGLDMASAATALGEELGLDGLQMRVGITTGQVAVSLGVVGEGMVAGDAVNTAARVQSVAAPGQVWVDDTTRSLTTASLAYAPVGSHELKGKAVPVELFHAVRTTAVVGGDQRVDGLEAPFVGRDRVLRLVKELFHATAEETHARLVLVAGEPGIGKTRLAWEFEKYADAITTQSTYWLRGRCLSYGKGVAGRVVAEMVRSLLRVTDTDDDTVVAAALDERLQRHVTDEQERAVLRPRLSSLLGLNEGTFDQADLFACWRGFFEALAGDGSSVTLVVEDLQWADDGFLDFLDHLLDAAQAPIMVLALARPEVTSRRSGLGAGRRSTTVFLEPLPDAAMGLLLDGLVADLPGALRAELVHRAEGIPLYAVETVRALIDRDVVVPAGGRYVLDPTAAASLDLAALGPPASLQALLAARLDALSPGERRVVQDASVLGLTFTRAGIEALAPPGLDLDAALEGLRRKEIVTVDRDPRSPERGQYRFVQALLRSVAYDTLSRRDRRARHIAVAAHLAQQPDAEAIAGVLAAHHLDALAALPEAADAEQLRGRAADLLEHAAEHALGVGAPGDAMVHYARLLELVTDDVTLVRAATAAADLANSAATRVEDTLGWVLAGLAAADRLGDEEGALRLRVLRADLLLALGSAVEAMAELREVFDACLGRPDRVTMLVRAARAFGIGAQATGDAQLVQDVILRALPDVECFGDDHDFAVFLNATSNWASLSGHRRLALVLRRSSAERYDDRDPQGIAPLLNVAVTVLHDDPLEAARLVRSGMQRARDLGLAGPRVVATGHLLMATTATGEWGEAVQALAAQRSDGVTDRSDWEAYVAASAAVLAWGRGDASLLYPGVTSAVDSTDPVVAGWSLMVQAVTAALRGDTATGADLSVRAVERMSELGPANEDLPPAYALAVDLLLTGRSMDRLRELTAGLESVPPGLRYRLLQGQLLRARAQLSDDSRPGLRAAIETFDAMGAAYWAARVRVELAQALADAGDGAGAVALLDAAEPLLSDIAAAPALTRAADLRSALDVPAV